MDSQKGKGLGMKYCFVKWIFDKTQGRGGGGVYKQMTPPEGVQKIKGTPHLYDPMTL